MNTLFKVASLTVLLGCGAAALAASPVEGEWDAKLVRKDIEIPFRLDISGSGATLKGTLYDGFHPYEYTTSASFKDGRLVLDIAHYLTTLPTSFPSSTVAVIVVR